MEIQKHLRFLFTSTPRPINLYQKVIESRDPVLVKILLSSKYRSEKILRKNLFFIYFTTGPTQLVLEKNDKCAVYIYKWITAYLRVITGGGCGPTYAPFAVIGGKIP